jgi:hypothetical protein
MEDKNKKNPLAVEENEEQNEVPGLNFKANSFSFAKIN